MINPFTILTASTIPRLTETQAHGLSLVILASIAAGTPIGDNIPAILEDAVPWFSLGRDQRQTIAIQLLLDIANKSGSQVLSGDADTPSTAPTNPNIPALYYPRNGGKISQWTPNGSGGGSWS